VSAALDLSYGSTGVDFTSARFDEGDEISGSGSAELLNHGRLEIEIAFHLGVEATLTAKRDPSSTPC
jgi:hypothetical protein